MKLIDNSLTSFRVKGRLPQWAIWTLAASLFGLTWLAVGAWARAAALHDLAQYTDQWNPDGTILQETNYTCVPASIVMLLKDEGFYMTTYEIATIAGTDIRGTGAAGIIRAGESFGFTVLREHLGFDEFLDRGLPGIVIFRYNGIPHAAYVLPVAGLIEVKDPVQGLLHFYKDGADEYFGGDTWDVYLFELN